MGDFVARLNIEDALFKDTRFFDLAIKLGSVESAMGSLVIAWMLAQKWFLKSDDGGIPLDEWKKQKIKNEIIEAGLADLKGASVYLRGSQEQFAWLRACSDAGKKSHPHKDQNLKQNSEGSPKGVEGMPKGRDPLSSSSLLSSLSPTQSLTLKSTRTSRKRSDPGTDKTLGSRIFESYSEAYLKRYSKEPIRNTTVNTQCMNIGKRLGEDAVEVAKFYVTHNRQYYVLKSHPIGLLLTDAEGLHTEWFNGKQTTTTEARAAENKQQIVNVWSKHLTPEGAK